MVKMCTGASAMHNFNANVYRCNEEVMFWRYQSPARVPGRSWLGLPYPKILISYISHTPCISYIPNIPDTPYTSYTLHPER